MRKYTLFTALVLVVLFIITGFTIPSNEIDKPVKRFNPFDPVNGFGIFSAGKASLNGVEINGSVATDLLIDWADGYEIKNTAGSKGFFEVDRQPLALLSNQGIRWQLCNETEHHLFVYNGQVRSIKNLATEVTDRKYFIGHWLKRLKRIENYSFKIQGRYQHSIMPQKDDPIFLPPGTGIALGWMVDLAVYMNSNFYDIQPCLDKGLSNPEDFIHNPAFYYLAKKNIPVIYVANSANQSRSSVLTNSPNSIVNINNVHAQLVASSMHMSAFSASIQLPPNSSSGNTLLLPLLRQNVVQTTLSQINNYNQMNLGGELPSANCPLLINIDGQGATNAEWNAWVSQDYGAANRNIIYHIYNVENLTILMDNDDFRGSIFAPNTNLTLYGRSKRVKGQIVCNDFVDLTGGIDANEDFLGTLKYYTN